MKNPFIKLMWVTLVFAAVVSNTVNDSLGTLWGLASWAPWLVTLGLVIGWAKARRP